MVPMHLKYFGALMSRGLLTERASCPERPPDLEGILSRELLVHRSLLIERTSGQDLRSIPHFSKMPFEKCNLGAVEDSTWLFRNDKRLPEEFSADGVIQQGINMTLFRRRLRAEGAKPDSNKGWKTGSGQVCMFVLKMLN